MLNCGSRHKTHVSRTFRLQSADQSSIVLSVMQTRPAGDRKVKALVSAGVWCLVLVKPNSDSLLKLQASRGNLLSWNMRHPGENKRPITSSLLWFLSLKPLTGIPPPAPPLPTLPNNPPQLILRHRGSRRAEEGSSGSVIAFGTVFGGELVYRCFRTRLQHPESFQLSWNCVLWAANFGNLSPQAVIINELLRNGG